jgi:transcriptional regulator with XRE-family HTH domain
VEGNVIRLIRQFSGKSQQELARELGVWQQQLSRWECAAAPRLPDQVISTLGEVAREAIDERSEDRSKIREAIRVR